MKLPSSVILMRTAAASLPFVLLFWTVPVDILRANESEFGGNCVLLAPYLGALILLCSLIAFAVVKAAHKADSMLLVLTSLGFIFLAMQCCYPGGMSESSAGKFILHKPDAANALLVVLAAALGSCVLQRLLGKAVYMQACAIASISLAAGGVLMLFTDVLTARHGRVAVSPQASVSSAHPNVYHFMLDAFSGDVFPAAMDGAAAQEAFRNFVFFSNAFSNFTRTQESVPSFLIGALPDWQHMRDWSSSFQDHGVLPEAKAAGYRIWSYGSERGLNFQQAYAQKSVETFEGRFRSALGGWFADLWLARVCAALLAPDYAQSGIGPVSNYIGQKFGIAPALKNLLSRKLFQSILSDEETRNPSGEYVYAHLLLPHSPYNFNKDCEFIAKGTNYFEQSVCSIKLVAEFIKRLDELGRLDSSLIIVQSDHGEYFSRPTFKPHMSQSVSDTFERDNIYGFSGQDIERRTKALLLIKPPNSRTGALENSSIPAQLLDLPATLDGLLHFQNQAPPLGVNLFSDQAKMPRSIDFFDGFIIMDSDKVTVRRFGQQFFAGEINHYSYSSDGTWAELPRVKVKW